MKLNEYPDPFGQLNSETRVQRVRALQEEPLVEFSYYLSREHKRAGDERSARFGCYCDGNVWAVWDFDSSDPDTLEWDGPFESKEAAKARAMEKATNLKAEADSWIAIEENEERDYALRTGQNLVKVQIELTADTAELLQDLVQHSNGSSAEYLKLGGVKELIEGIAEAWADGWQRPGSWEREMLRSMGHAE